MAVPVAPEPGGAVSLAEKQGEAPTRDWFNGRRPAQAELLEGGRS